MNQLRLGKLRERMFKSVMKASNFFNINKKGGDTNLKKLPTKTPEKTK